MKVDPSLSAAINGVVRWVMPILVILIVVRCAYSLFRGKQDAEIWGYVKYPDGHYAPLRHWENILGRARGADVRLDVAGVSRIHAVLVRHQKGTWSVCETGRRSEVTVNGKAVDGEMKVKFGDVIGMGEGQITLVKHPEEEATAPAPVAVGPLAPWVTLVLLSAFSLLGMLALLVNVSVNPYLLLFVFGATNAVMWGYYLFMHLIRRSGFEVECLAFLLTLLGFCLTASVTPYDLLKQFIAFVIGLGLFLFVGWCLRDLNRSQVMRWLMSAVGLGLLVLTFAFAETVNGARNWLFIGGMSIQPSELAKICFVYAGAATLDRLVAKRNLLLYILFTGLCVGLLALMNDFGTALIFFITFVAVAFLRSGRLSAIFLSGASAGLAALMVLKFRPYVLNRFKAWRKVWMYADSLGYQQTHVMACAASGGMLGLGIGRGWLKYVAAADTDLVFGVLCEEWGLLVALAAVSVIVILAVFALWQTRIGRSTFYSIASCAAVSMMLVQTLLNVGGSVDLLPLTGVTFPFVSNGGSGMLCAWGLLAFVKAADLRPGASFAIKRAAKGRD